MGIYLTLRFFPGEHVLEAVICDQLQACSVARSVTLAVSEFELLPNDILDFRTKIERQRTEGKSASVSFKRKDCEMARW